MAAAVVKILLEKHIALEKENNRLKQNVVNLKALAHQEQKESLANWAATGEHGRLHRFDQQEIKKSECCCVRTEGGELYSSLSWFIY